MKLHYNISPKEGQSYVYRGTWDAIQYDYSQTRLNYESPPKNANQSNRAKRSQLCGRQIFPHRVNCFSAHRVESKRRITTACAVASNTFLVNV